MVDYILQYERLFVSHSADEGESASITREFRSTCSTWGGIDEGCGDASGEIVLKDGINSFVDI